MSTIRGVKDRRFKFVQLLNSMFEDPNLSLKAKGFIGFCLTKKEDWDFHISHLCKVLKEGEDAIYSTIKECIEHGYAYRYQARGKDGRMLPGEFIVSDSKLEIETLKQEYESRPDFKKSLPNRENKDAESPDRENAEPVSPREIPSAIYSNTDSSNTQKEQQQQPAAVSLSRSFEEHGKPRISPKLHGINIPPQDKFEIASKYDEKTIDDAIDWCHHPETKIKQTLAQALKWACANKITPPKPPIDLTIENHSYAKKYDGMKNGGYTINVLSKCVEIDYGTAYKQPFTLEYTVKAFKEQFENALRKANFPLISNALGGIA